MRLIQFVSFLLSMLLEPLMVSKFWLWFIVPLGVPPIDFFQALGFNLFVVVILSPYLLPLYMRSTREVNSEDIIADSVSKIIIYVVYFLIGFIVSNI